MIIIETFIFFLSFSDIGQNTFALLSKTTQKDFEKCFLLVQRKTLRKNIFIKILVCLILSRLLAKKIRPFVGKTLAVLSNLQSTYTIELFKEKYIVLKKICFFITVGVRAEDFELFAKIVRQFCEHCFRRAQRKNMRKNVSLSRSEFGRNIF